MPTGAVHRGFTLLELLVVLVVIAIGTSLVSARLMPDDQRLLDREAERLAQILSVAQEYSSVRAETIAFIPTTTGFRFTAANPDGSLLTRAGNPLPIRDDLLRPRDWQTDAVRVSIQTEGQSLPALIISPEPGLTRTLIELQARQARSIIVRRVSGRFQVVRP